MDRRMLAGRADRCRAEDLLCLCRDVRWRRGQRAARWAARADTGTRSVVAVRVAVSVGWLGFWLGL
jgi:hypothetical protein